MPISKLISFILSLLLIVFIRFHIAMIIVSLGIGSHTPIQNVLLCVNLLASSLLLASLTRS